MAEEIDNKLESEVTMNRDSRAEILGRLHRVPRVSIAPRPMMPPLKELQFPREELMERLINELTLLGVTSYRVTDERAVLSQLTEIVTAEGISYAMISPDDVVLPLNLPAWGKENGIRVSKASDFTDRDTFKRAVFEEVQVGITGVNFAVAESGTLGIIHGTNQPRLVSLAPVLHIAIVPAARVVPTYEVAVREVFKDATGIPSQFTFITGPSMTADIKATPFNGMHGPRRLIVIIYGK